MNPIVVERPAVVRLAALPPLALYVHIPWCVRKCPYCDFNSHERKGPLPEHAYVARLLEDLEALLPSIWGRRVGSVFIGGGTPSLFAAASIDKLLSGVRARVQLDPGAEITLEANPGAVEEGRFAGFGAAGVNRISVGVQSFDDRMLAALGRIHSGADARRTVEAALRAIGNVNLDLMYGLPGQSSRARGPISRRASRPGCRICPLTSSPWSRTRCSGTSRRRCPSTTPSPTCSKRWRRRSAPRGLSTMRLRRSPGRGTVAGTI
jgi:hypothetical protein